MTSSDAGLTAQLKARGMRVTSQRLLINRALHEHDGHVTAEQVHELVAPSLPGVSHQTVYNTLQLLAELGVARYVATAGGSTTFETRLDKHHHMVCQVCGGVTDLDVAIGMRRAIDAAEGAGFRPENAMVTVLGRCAECA